MKLINSSFEIIEQAPSIEGLNKHIEKCGRVAYKSEDKITNNSAEAFVNKLITAGHYSPLEHGTVYIKLPLINKIQGDSLHTTVFDNNPYSRVYKDKNYSCITTNYRVLLENNWLNYLEYQCKPTEFHEKRITIKLVLSRAIANEFVRHRKFSFTQESTRYCRYSNDKFGNEITCIIPYWVTTKCTDNNQSSIDWSKAMQNSEKSYFELLNEGCTAQETRGVLPLDLKTELIMTGFVSDWENFFKLRTAEGAHPDARGIACEIQKKLKKLEYI